MRVLLSVLILLVAFSAQAEISEKLTEAIDHQNQNPINGEAFPEGYQGYAVVIGFDNPEWSFAGIYPLWAPTFEEAFASMQTHGDFISAPFTLYYIDLVNGYATKKFDKNGCIKTDDKTGEVYTAIGQFNSTIPHSEIQNLSIHTIAEPMVIDFTWNGVENSSRVEELEVCRGSINHP